MNPGTAALEDAAPDPSGAAPDPSPRWRWLTAVVALLATGAALPVILLGAMSPLVRPAVGASPLVWGWVLATYYGVSSLVSVGAGRLGQRLAVRVALPLGAAGSVIGLAGIALATRWWHLVALLVVAGFGSALVHPAANLALARYVPRRALGPVFGFKQASVPFAAMLAGFALPAIGLTLGWRAAFVVFAVGLAAVAASTLFAVPRTARRPHGTPTKAAPSPKIRASGPIGVLAVGAGLGVAANTAVNAFFVESVVAAGLSAAEAGVMFGVGSAVAIGGRLFWGVRLNGRDGLELLRYTGLIITTGSGGLLLLAATDDRLLLWLAMLTMFITVGAWNGIFELAVVDLYHRAPAAASGVAATGMRAGGLLGPVVFGFVSTHTSIRIAWIAMAVGCIAGAAIVFVGRVRIVREQLAAA